MSSEAPLGEAHRHDIGLHKGSTSEEEEVTRRGYADAVDLPEVNGEVLAEPNSLRHGPEVREVRRAVELAGNTQHPRVRAEDPSGEVLDHECLSTTAHDRAVAVEVIRERDFMVLVRMCLRDFVVLLEKCPKGELLEVLINWEALLQSRDHVLDGRVAGYGSS